MDLMASQITSLTIVYSTVYSAAEQRKYRSSASLAFMWGIHRWPVNSQHKWPVTRKMFPFDDVIMTRRYPRSLLTLSVVKSPNTFSVQKSSDAAGMSWLSIMDVIFVWTVNYHVSVFDIKCLYPPVAHTWGFDRLHAARCDIKQFKPVTKSRWKQNGLPFAGGHFQIFKVRGDNMGPIWGRQDPGGLHVGPINFAITAIARENDWAWSFFSKELWILPR